jgi:predicted PurR-regulated permease PerM
VLWLLEDPTGRPERIRTPPRGSERVPPALTVASIACAIGTLFTFAPLWPSLILASWVAAVIGPALERLAPSSSKRRRLVAFLLTLVVLLFVAALALVAMSLVEAGFELAQTLMKTDSGSAALRALVANGGRDHDVIDIKHLRPEEVAGLVRQYGSDAATALGTVAGATTEAVIGAVVFVGATYALLVSRERAYGWLVEHAVVPPRILRRFADAWVETGRGLLIGIGLTALLQAVVAGAGYVILGVPRPAALGFLTFLAALVPTLGTALVWVPVAAALALSGRPGAALVMSIFGLVAGIVDNIARPWLSRWGQLRLTSFVVFVAMLGGLSAFGAWGLVLGPLFVRLMVEALELLREYRSPSPLT